MCSFSVDSYAVNNEMGKTHFDWIADFREILGTTKMVWTVINRNLTGKPRVY